VLVLLSVFAACSSGSGDGGSGATGGAGGAGGSLGGSSGVGGSGGGAIYGAVCGQVEALSCWSGDCESYAQGTLDQAQAKNCVPQALAAFDCYAATPPICDPDKGLTEDPACTAAVTSYLTCLQGSGACTQSGFLGGCAVICGSIWGAQCRLEEGNSYWSCNCRVGPKVGTQFTHLPTEKCDETLSAEQCAP
jgi:hypothetical protein